jgi:hypothetical protein
MSQDFLSLLKGCVVFFASHSLFEFLQTVAVGLLMAAVCWWACSRFSRLWHLGYRIAFWHQIFCFVAALFTLIFTIVFVALQYSKQAADASVQKWEAQINVDRVWAAEVYAQAWEKVKASGLEDFTNYPAPSQPKSKIPLTKDGSIRITAMVYTRAGLEHFVQNRPFLSRIISAQANIPQQMLNADVKAHFAAGNNSYPVHRAVELVARETKAQLETQLPRVVTTLRIIEVVLFSLLQLIPFGLVGFAAYRALKVTTSSDRQRMSI